jgi:hypothetical protein
MTLSAGIRFIAAWNAEVFSNLRASMTANSVMTRDARNVWLRVIGDAKILLRKNS